MADQNQEQPIVAQSSEEQQLQHSVDPTTYLLYHAHAPCTTPLCCSFGSKSNNNSNSNSMRRRSPSSSATPTLQGRATKKLLRDQENHLTLNGFSTISFPLSHATLNTKPCHAATAADGSFPATPFHYPEHANNAVGRACSLSPLPRSLKGFVSDPTPSPATRTFSHSSTWGHDDKGVILTNNEASNSMRLRRMKDCLREMRKWWDQVMLEEEEKDEDEPQGAEGDKVLLSKDDCGGDHAEEAVSVEWAEKCLSICFKCPCSKGYQILLSGNNCYYKLV